MKIYRISPDLDKTHPVTFLEQDLLWKQIESVQVQVDEIHKQTIWKATHIIPYKLSKEILERMYIVRIIEPQYNRQWLEQKGQRIGPIIETSLV